MTFSNNFDLYLSASQDELTVQVTASPAGETAAAITASCILPASPAGGLDHAIGDDLQAMGRALWSCTLGQPAVAELWRASLAATGPEDLLRLRLTIDSDALAALPWELLYDPTLGRYLALDGRTPLCRYLRLPLSAIPWPADRPLHLCFTGASPTDLKPLLPVAQECSAIEADLQPLVDDGRLILTAIPERAGLSDLNRALRRQVDLWHFAGHGYQGGLAFAKQENRAVPADAGTLGQLLAGEGVRLALLNACWSAAGNDDSSSVSLALVRAGIPAVVAMQWEVFDRAARAFSPAFYDAIAAGQPVDRAVTSGRKAVLALGGNVGNTWWVPVLTMRSPDGRIWQPPPEERQEILEPGSTTIVHGDHIEAEGDVATHGSAIARGGGTAIVGNDNIVISGDVDGDLKIGK